MYDFITHTWNPLAGECPHKCSYCSTNKLIKRYLGLKKKYSGDIRFSTAVYDSLGSGKFIFVVAQNDLFAEGVDSDFTDTILRNCCKYPDNKYLFQSKNPHGIWMNYKWLPKNSVVCTTIETNRYYPSMYGCPSTQNRAIHMEMIAQLGIKTFVTVEPVMDFDLPEMVELIKQCKPEQVNIGSDSGNNHLLEPSKEKLLALIDELKKFTVIAKKTNLERLLK